MPNKLLVEIIGAQGIKQRKKFKVDQDSVILRKGRGRGITDWKPKFTRDNLLDYTVGVWPFKRLKRKLMIREGASSFMDFSSNGTDHLPDLTLKDIENLADAKVIKNAGKTTQKVTVPLSLYVISLLTLCGVGVLFFYVWDRFR